MNRTLGLLLAASVATGLEARAQAVVPPATVIESPFKFERDKFTLYGTLTLPRDTSRKPPVVLIVAGSGPTDRNANGPLIHTNAYAMLAWGLAENGIASLRYDKRAIGQSAWPAVDPTRLSLFDYVLDAAAGAQALDATHRFDRVFLLGHSEGAGVVALAALNDSSVSGVIMVAGTGRKLADVLHDQFALQADSATVTRIDTAFARYLQGESAPAGLPQAAQMLMLPMNRTFVKSLADYDPIATVGRLKPPLLIVQGRTDLQVLVEDAELLHKAQPRATLALLPDVNHVLKSVSTTVPAEQQKSYHDPTIPIAASVVSTIARWIATVPPSR